MFQKPISSLKRYLSLSWPARQLFTLARELVVCLNPQARKIYFIYPSFNVNKIEDFILIILQHTAGQDVFFITFKALSMTFQWENVNHE